MVTCSSRISALDKRKSAPPRAVLQLAMELFTICVELTRAAPPVIAMAAPEHRLFAPPARFLRSKEFAIVIFD